MFGNRLEKLLYNNDYNYRHKGECTGEHVYSIFDIPGKLYKTAYLGQEDVGNGIRTHWIVATKIEGVGIVPYVEIRRAVLARDESYYFICKEALGVFYSSDDVSRFIKIYKNRYKEANKIIKFR